MGFVVSDRIQLSQSDHPPTALMIDAIMGDQMPLEYAQLILTNSEEQILESEFVDSNSSLFKKN